MMHGHISRESHPSSLIKWPLVGWILCIIILLGAVYLDIFERLTDFVEQNPFYEWEEIFVVLIVFGGAFLLFFAYKTFGPRSSGKISRRDFIKELAGEKAREGEEVAVFIVEMGADVDEKVLEHAGQQLEHLVGESNLTSFRVR